MLNWAMTFLVLALIAAVLGFTGVAGTASHIAWILFRRFPCYVARQPAHRPQSPGDVMYGVHLRA